MAGETITTEVLLAHRFQGDEPPGLYPEADTVCSCQMSPKTAPDDDYRWWVDHLRLMSDGHVHDFTDYRTRWQICIGCGDARKVD